MLLIFLIFSLIFEVVENKKEPECAVLDNKNKLLDVIDVGMADLETRSLFIKIFFDNEGNLLCCKTSGRSKIFSCEIFVFQKI